MHPGGSPIIHNPTRRKARGGAAFSVPRVLDGVAPRYSNRPIISLKECKNPGTTFLKPLLTGGMETNPPTPFHLQQTNQVSLTEEMDRSSETRVVDGSSYGAPPRVLKEYTRHWMQPISCGG